MSDYSDNNEEKDKKGNPSAKEYFQFGEVLGYFFRKKDPSRPTSFNLRMMHGINKISILMFLIAIVIFIIKRFI